MQELRVGDQAPEFEVMTHTGELFRLSEHRGSPVVLYFYPEDDTEGCTIENREFSSELPAFQNLGVTVLGISPDTVEKHCAFRDKYQLEVPLAADAERQVIQAFGVWGEKNSFGHRHIGLRRTTFLVGADGLIAGIFPVRRIKGHAAQVLAAARQLEAK